MDERFPVEKGEKSGRRKAQEGEGRSEATINPVVEKGHHRQKKSESKTIRTKVA